MAKIAMDWEKARGAKLATYYDPPRPAGWPEHLTPISIDGVGLFGIHPKGQLYWDGEEIVVTRKLELTLWQQRVAGMVALVGILVGLVELLGFFEIKNAAELWAWPKSLALPR